MEDNNLNVAVQFTGDISDIQAKLETLTKSYTDLANIINKSFRKQTQKKSTAQDTKAEATATKEAATASADAAKAIEEEANAYKNLSDALRLVKSMKNSSRSVKNLEASLSSIASLDFNGMTEGIQNAVNAFKAFSELKPNIIQSGIVQTANSVSELAYAFHRVAETHSTFDELNRVLMVLERHGITANEIFSQLAKTMNGILDTPFSPVTPSQTEETQPFNVSGGQGYLRGYEEPISNFEKSATDLDVTIAKVQEKLDSLTVNPRVQEVLSESLAGMREDFDAANQKIDEVTARVQAFEEINGKIRNQDFSQSLNSFVEMGAYLSQATKNQESLLQKYAETSAQISDMNALYKEQYEYLVADAQAAKDMMRMAEQSGDVVQKAQAQEAIEKATHALEYFLKGISDNARYQGLRENLRACVDDFNGFQNAIVHTEKRINKSAEAINETFTMLTGVNENGDFTWGKLAEEYVISLNNQMRELRGAMEEAGTAMANALSEAFATSEGNLAQLKEELATSKDSLPSAVSGEMDKIISDVAKYESDLTKIQEMQNHLLDERLAKYVALEAELKAVRDTEAFEIANKGAIRETTKAREDKLVQELSNFIAQTSSPELLKAYNNVTDKYSSLDAKRLEASGKVDTLKENARIAAEETAKIDANIDSMSKMLSGSLLTASSKLDDSFKNVGKSLTYALTQATMLQVAVSEGSTRGMSAQTHLSRMSDDLKNWVKELSISSELSNKYTKAINESLSSKMIPVRAVGRKMQELKEEYDAGIRSLSYSANSIEAIGKDVEKLTSEYNALGKSIESVKNEILKESSALESQKANRAKMLGQWRSDYEKLEEQLVSLNAKAAEEIAKNGAPSERTAQSIRNVTAQMESLLQTMRFSPQEMALFKNIDVSIRNTSANVDNLILRLKQLQGERASVDARLKSSMARAESLYNNPRLVPDGRKGGASTHAKSAYDRNKTSGAAARAQGMYDNTQGLKDETKNAAEQLDKLSKTADKWRDTSKSAGNSTNDFVNSLKQLGKVLMSIVKSAINRTVKLLKSLASTLVSIGSKSIQNTIGLPFKLIEKAIRSITSLFNMLKTRIKRRVVAEMFEDLTSNLGAMAEQRNEFNESMSSMVVAMRMFGAQAIAVVQPILELLAPAIEYVSNLLTGVADKLSQFTAVLNGQDKYFKASEGVYDFANAMKEAAGETDKSKKAAKEYENTVMGFDQLNKLNGTKDNSSSSTTSKVSPANLKQEMVQANAFNDLAKKIRDAFKSGDFKNAGKYVAEAVNDAFSWLDDVAGWEKNADKIESISKSIIDFVNGFSEGLDPKAIGHAIGDVLNSGIEMVKMLTDPSSGINFELIGRNLGEILQNAVNTIKAEDLGKAFMQTIQSFVRTAVGFLQTPNLFSDIGVAFHDAIKGATEALSPDDWSDMISGLINGLGEFLMNAFDNSDGTFSKLGEKIGKTITDIFAKLDADKISGGINAFTEAIVSFVGSAIENLDFGTIGGKLAEIGKKINWGNLIKTIGLFAIPFIPKIILPLLKTAFGMVSKGLGGIAGLIGKLLGFKNSTSLSDIGKSFVSNIKTIATAFLGASAFIGILAEVGLLIKEYADVLQKISDVNLSEDYKTKLDAVLGMVGSMSIMVGIVTAISTALSKLGAGGAMLAGEGLTALFMGEVWAAAKIVEEYASAVQKISEINLSGNYDANLNAVLGLVLTTSTFIGILDALNGLITYLSGGIGAVVIAAAEGLTGGFMYQLSCAADILEKYAETVDKIGSLDIDESKYYTNLNLLLDCMEDIENFFASQFWKGLVSLPGEISEGINMAVVQSAMSSLSELVDLELPSSEKIQAFGEAAKELSGVFGNNEGFWENIWSGIKGIAEAFGNGADMSNTEAMQSQVSMMSEMMETIAKLSEDTTSSDSISGNWENAMTLVSDTTIENMGSVLETVTSSLADVEKAFRETKLEFPQDIKLPHFNLEGVFSMENGTVPSISVDWYKNGGVVGDGQLFVANENGVEAITRGDNGKTVVTNNEQMIQAISNGVRAAMVDAVRAVSGNNNDNAGGDIVLYVDSEELARASLRGQRSLDKRLNPVIQFA